MKYLPRGMLGSRDCRCSVVQGFSRRRRRRLPAARHGTARYIPVRHITVRTRRLPVRGSAGLRRTKGSAFKAAAGAPQPRRARIGGAGSAAGGATPRGEQN